MLFWFTALHSYYLAFAFKSVDLCDILNSKNTKQLKEAGSVLRNQTLMSQMDHWRTRCPDYCRQWFPPQSQYFVSPKINHDLLNKMYFSSHPNLSPSLNLFNHCIVVSIRLVYEARRPQIDIPGKKEICKLNRKEPNGWKLESMVGFKPRRNLQTSDYSLTCCCWYLCQVYAVGNWGATLHWLRAGLCSCAGPSIPRPVLGAEWQGLLFEETCYKQSFDMLNQTMFDSSDQ